MITDLAYIKAVDQVNTSLPIEVNISCTIHINSWTLTLYKKIVTECLASALVALVGVVFSVDAFKPIAMETEVAKMYVIDSI